MGILDLLGLEASQRQAATASGDLVVTAGAGSGKTRTLVARYLALLEAGLPLRSIVAITFTDKAAREMRTRIRQTIASWLATSGVSETSEVSWQQAFADLDAARIGTIHSLCAQILREHPVEATRLGFAPGFGVLEEGRAAVLRARAVEDALAWAAADKDASRLFAALEEHRLRAVLAALLERRLDAAPAFEWLGSDPLQHWKVAVRNWLSAQLDDPEWQGFLAHLASLCADDPDDRMEVARRAVLARAEQTVAALRRDDVDAMLAELTALRRAAVTNVGRKANWPGDTLDAAKETMRALRAYFDERLAPLADSDKSAMWLDEHVTGLVGALHAAYQRALDAYAQARRAEHALDFDDLEAGALELLRDESVRMHWQATIRAVLVDEFQDTNERQRRIIYSLTGFTPHASHSNRASLFIVGDPKQSIYRFRGADVTVFRQVQDDIECAGGQVIALDRTYRAHAPLIEATEHLLKPIMVARPGRPYETPFAPLKADRPEPRPGIAAPFIEFLLGVMQAKAEDHRTADNVADSGDEMVREVEEAAGDGRRIAADALAARLLELHAREGVEWGDVALLFRASTSFPVYEDALERAGIPFVTVAGRGFYERPEVRIALNALAAVADPTDDLALVGFLRSPAIGLSDAALYLLRFPPSASPQPRSIWETLSDPTLAEILPPAELPRARRACEVIETLHHLAGRVSVAALLKRLLDETGYRAALQATGGPRAVRNLDKLLTDAHTSGLVSVREFAEYVQTLRDAGARESEAPTEAGSAVQLMTVHKAKGLEFPVVVIADAAYAGHSQSPAVFLDERLGVTFDLWQAEKSRLAALRGDERAEEKRCPAAYQLARLHDKARDEAESRRLLYVAATRAQEKLLVSAHTRIKKDGTLSLAGWLKWLGEAVGLDTCKIAGTPTEAHGLPPADDVACVLYPYREEKRRDKEARKQEGRATPLSQDIVAPLVALSAGPDPKLAVREAEPPPRVWRVVPTARRPVGPAWVVGTLVHAALRYWRFPDQAGLEDFLRPYALEAGLTDPQEIHRTIGEARRLLARFQAHPLYAALAQAERRHEVPYAVEMNGALKSGIIDLLARLDDGWTLLEFKTDEVRAQADLATHIREERYDEQVREYVAAITHLLGERPQALLVFLNVGSKVVVTPIPEAT